MSSLLNEFVKFKRKYLPEKHGTTEKYRKDRKNIVIKFLKFAESKNVKSISHLNQDLYINYISYLKDVKKLSDKRIAFIKKILNEFFSNAGLNIWLNTTPKSESKIAEFSKKLDKLNFLDENQKVKIISIADKIWGKRG